MSDSARELALCGLSVETLAAMYRRGDTSPSEIVRLTLDRIQRLNPLLHAFLDVADDALSAAEVTTRELRAGMDRGLLHGVPLAVKDNIDVAGARTTAASRVLADAPSAMADAPVVARLRSAGAIIMGKTNLTEFAVGEQDPEGPYSSVENPRRVGHRAGSSSSGSAAAVAAGLSFVALGTDTGGSIRHPASVCGVVGLKPTYGLVPIQGVIPVSVHLDHVGVLTRSVHDCAVGLTAIAGHWPTDSYSARHAREDYSTYRALPTTGLRFGVPTNSFFQLGTSRVRSLVATAHSLLREAGLIARAVDVPRAEETNAIVATLLTVDLVLSHQRYRSKRHLYGRNLLERMEPATTVSALDYADARRLQVEVRHEWSRLFEGVDVLILPANIVGAPRHDEETVTIDGVGYPFRMATSRFNRAANLVGFPAISVPVGRTEDGLPIGVQIIGPPFTEARVLAVAAMLESATARDSAPWSIEPTFGPDLAR